MRNGSTVQIVPPIYFTTWQKSRTKRPRLPKMEILGYINIEGGFGLRFHCGCSKKPPFCFWLKIRLFLYPHGNCIVCHAHILPTTEDISVAFSLHFILRTKNRLNSKLKPVLSQHYAAVLYLQCKQQSRPYEAVLSIHGEPTVRGGSNCV